MMIFCIGGKAQGKSEFVSHYADEGYKIYDDFHECIKADLMGGQDTRRRVDELIGENIVIVGTEMGCGIVPMDPVDRRIREYNGRINCYIAERADEVYLINCGVAQRIK